MRIAALIAVLGAATLDAVNAAAPAPIACESLAQIKVTNGRLLSAVSVQAGAFAPPNTTNANATAAFKTLPAFCRVTLMLTPSSDSDIRVEVWLPQSGWNHKLQASGNGGLGGAIPYPAMAASVKAAYAAAGTDAGHVGGNADFVAGHPEKLVDFAYRAIHEMTVTAKTIVTAHYDARATRAYFNSCSTGGRQALIEAQRYPDDFDGIVAGDPSWDQMRLYAARVWLNTYVNRTPAAVIPASKYPMIHNAVLDKCDALDGVKDGVIEDPTKCSFDFATLTCRGDDRADCLTNDQVETANAMARPIRDPKSGAVLHLGRYYPGSELGWGGVAGPSPSGESHEGMQKIVFAPDWDYHTINVPDDVERAVKADKGLFMVPGMGHCQGGAGTDVFDKVAAVDQWVETGNKPQSIEAAHMTGGVVDRTRPLCAYPATAHYNGTGGTDDAKNFRCQ
jgi:feruloyl esterase